MLDPKSNILSALYQMKRDDATRLADAAPSLTVWEAAALGRSAVVARLLDGDPALVDAYAPDGHTPLGLACFFGAPDVVRLLLDRGADVRRAANNDMKVQPLHAAIAGRNMEAVRMLVERGADVNARQQIGYTPLMGAASAGSEEMLALLLRHGADPAVQSEDGKTAADVAREHKHDALVARLMPASA